MAGPDTRLRRTVPDRLRSQWASFPQWVRRAAVVGAGVVGFMLLLSVVYHLLLIRVEGRSTTFVESLQVVVETFTGTGYGSDSPWETPVTNLFVIAMDLSTFLALFVVLPYLFQPILENAFAPTLPASVDLDDHVVVCGVPRLTDRLVTELGSRDVPVVVVAAEEADALERHERGTPVIHGDPTSADALRRAGVDRARAAIVDTGDRRAASALLALGEIAPDLRAVAVVDHLEHERQLRHAGADRVITPRTLLGRRIAERVHRVLDPARSDAVALGEDVSLLELSVGADDALSDRSVREIEAMTDVSVVGVWADGEFTGAPSPDTETPGGTVLLVAGSNESLAELEAEVFDADENAPSVVVAGNGLVGSTVRRALDNHACRVVDDTDEAADVVGDATEPETLRRARLPDADVFVVALPDDDLAVLSVLAADEIAHGLDVIARMNAAEDETKLRRAGAEYVLGEETITGRLLVGDVLREEVIGFDRQIRIVRVDGARFAGRPLGETPIADSACAFAGIERDGSFRTDPPEELDVRDGDTLVIVGSDDEIERIRSRL